MDVNSLEIIKSAYNNKFLYTETIPLAARPVIPINDIYTALTYLRILPIPSKIEDANDNYALFSQVEMPAFSFGRETDGIRIDLDKLLSTYKWAEEFHKRTENHHPDGSGWIYGISTTIECVFDVFCSLLRTCTLEDAYSTLFVVLSLPKFNNLDIQGIFYAFLHISIRGVSNSYEIYTLSNWRRIPLTQLDALKISRDFSLNKHDKYLVSCYIRETTMHSRCINKEMYILTGNYVNHDYTKYEPLMVYIFTWYWGVYQKFTDYNKKLFAERKYNLIKHVEYLPY